MRRDERRYDERRASELLRHSELRQRRGARDDDRMMSEDSERRSDADVVRLRCQRDER